MAFSETRWGKISFSDEKMKTDLMLYKELSYLLIPSEGEENRFVINSGDDFVDVFFGSTSHRNYTMMESFFSRVYGCFTEKAEEPQLKSERNLMLVNSVQNRRRGDFYYPEFIRNVAYLPSSLKNIEMSYRVSLRSSLTKIRRDKRFSFYVFMGFDGDVNSMDEATSYFRRELRYLKEEKKWKFRIPKSERTRIRTNLLYRDFNLANFLRIPEDKQSH